MINKYFNIHSRLSREISRQLEEVAKVIETTMKEDKEIPFNDYKEKVKSMTKMCDFIEIFSDVNNKLVEDDKKLKLSKAFYNTTNIMNGIKEVLTSMKIKPFNGEISNIWKHYYMINEYERICADAKSMNLSPS